MNLCSLTPFGSGTPMFRERLRFHLLNPFEVALMKEWESINTAGDGSPLYAIIADYFAGESSGQLFLPVGAFAASPFIDSISSSVQWAGTNVGQCDYRAFVKRGKEVTAAMVRRYFENDRRIHTVDQVLHAHNPACGTLQYGLLFGAHKGCCFLPLADVRRQVFFITVRWLLSPPGQELWRRALAKYQKAESVDA